MAVKITPAHLPGELPTIRQLFTDYAEGLGVDLGFQDFQAELDGLPGKYAAPHGTILLARRDDTVLGCIAMRPLDPKTCEMKRLYVTPEGRGLGLGASLSRALMDAARAAGYRRMVLDTLDSLTPAIRVYERLGFQAIPPYYDNPLPGVVYMGVGL